MASYLALLIVISATTSNILSNIAASVLENFLQNRTGYGKLDHRIKLTVTFLLFCAFLAPSSYIQYRDYVARRENVNSMLTKKYLSVEIEEGQSAILFDGEIFISVDSVSTVFRTTSFTIGSPGQENVRTEDVDVGYSLVYSGESNFGIRINHIGWGGFLGLYKVVTFSVVKIES